MPSAQCFDPLARSRASRIVWRGRAAMWVWIGMGLALMSACSPALNWREVRPRGAGMALSLPCKPSVYARKLPLAGVSVDWNLQACSVDGQTWAFAHADLRDPNLVREALLQLRTAAQANLQDASAVPVVWAAPGATPQAEAARFRLQGKLPDGRVVVEEVAVFARGTTVFQMSMLGPALPAESSEAFFSSVRAL
jgi:hypothetical protein